jgi:hypothetical protein
MKQITPFLFYRGIFFTGTGRLCRARIAGCSWMNWALIAMFLASMTEAKAQVDLPPPPSAAPPPQEPKGQTAIELRHEEHVKAQTKQLDEIKTEREQQADKKLEEQAKQEKVEPRPMYGFMEINFLYAKVLTTGTRKNYLADPTTHFNGWLRTSSSKPSDQPQLWAGFRIAPFSGSGVQRKHAGRYALTYFGPGLGFGKIQSQGKIINPDDTETRTGWLFSGGVAAVTKLSRHDEPADTGATDFRSTPWAMDSPGVWLEYRAMRVFNAALSGNLIVGGQMAEGKNFVYLGLGFAGWL